MTGEQLKKKRLGLELTQEQLAGALSVDRNTVARWEREERAIPPYLELALQTLQKPAAKHTKKKGAK